MSVPVRSLKLGPDGTLSNRVFLDDEKTAAVLALLNQGGEEARIVGGAVRNALIGLQPGDIDITTTATPEVVTARVKSTGRMRVIPTGIAHGTVTVMVAKMPFEVTTLRQDVETDGRHAVVKFGRDFAEDALRRDFTINALSVDQAGIVHDYAGGVADLAAGRVRFIGDAATRIREDYLRILRFFRFSAAYSTGPLDPDGISAAKAGVDGLARLSRERVRAEMLKLLAAPNAPPAVTAMDACGVLTAILGHPASLERYPRFAAIAAARGIAPDALLSLAALALRDHRDIGRLRDRLRLSNEERDRFLKLVNALEVRGGSVEPPGSLDVVALLFGFGRQATVDAIMIAHAGSAAAPDDEGWTRAVSQAVATPVPSLPISGADILARGVQSGPLVGKVLKEFQALWIRAGFPDRPAVLHSLLDDAISVVRGGLV